MEKSIEKIWNQGFLKDEDLLAPKLTNLYNQKSKLVLEKLKSTYRKDNMSILPIAILFALGLSYTGHIILGIYGMALMIGMYFLNRKQLQSLEAIEITTNSFDYLIKYRKSLRELMKFTTRLLGIGFPVAGMIGYWLYFRDTALYQDFLKLDLLFIILIIFSIGAALSAIGILAYRLSTKLVYGKSLTKLNEIIADMTELQK